ncbi:MAG: C-GCAxxG-C-C family protein [Elusimicrobiota bacterium]|jgi:C_GCAxxG_C_C family probable redox protein
MSHNDKALKLFSEGANCAQSVLAAFCDETGLDQAQALKAAACFGGGMKQGLTCGAVTGGLIVLGLKHGCADHKDAAAKTRITALTREFAAYFQKRHKACACKDLLGVDISTQAGHDAAAAQGLFKSKCPLLIASAVEVLEQIFP